MEPASILARLGQYLGAAGLFGGALLLARQSPRRVARNERRLVLTCALVLTGATLVSLVIQSAMMGGRSDPWSDPSAVGAVLTQTSFGVAVVVRLLVSVVAIFVLARSPRRQTLSWLAGLGVVATASLAWGGHGVADEGVAGGVHLAADIVHLLAAGLWIGALAMLVVMAADARAALEPASALRLYGALAGFSGAGTLAVGLLILTGVANAWFLIGPTHVSTSPVTLYGGLLLIKLALFVAMAALAVVNRWRLTPRLGAGLDRGEATVALRELRRSLALETGVAVLVLAVVGWLGTLAPPMAG